jgi:hypothetical protein
MADYHMDEAIFDVPSGWTDRSVHALSCSLPNSRDRLALTVSRQSAPPGAALEGLVDRALKQQRQVLHGFEILEREEGVDVGGLSGTSVRARWRNADGPVYLRHVYLTVYGRLLGFTGTCKYKHREACDEQIEAILGTLAFREERP